MDWETFVDDVTVEPEPEQLRLDYYEGGNWLGVNFPLEPNTNYRVTIPAAAADPYGEYAR